MKHGPQANPECARVLILKIPASQTMTAILVLTSHPVWGPVWWLPGVLRGASSLRVLDMSVVWPWVLETYPECFRCLCYIWSIVSLSATLQVWELKALCPLCDEATTGPWVCELSSSPQGPPFTSMPLLSALSLVGFSMPGSKFTPFQIAVVGMSILNFSLLKFAFRQFSHARERCMPTALIWNISSVSLPSLSNPTFPQVFQALDCSFCFLTHWV